MWSTGGLFSEWHCGNMRNKTLIFQAWDEERDQGVVPQLDSSGGVCSTT